ncbi:uncharacterized protein K02A2.6-like [Ceratina calcarata]|uniref:RNA-directed DNA polymerase n=1 Tax=Ceratina calcarata TaxID=156304 RepID=A0AAJ7J4B7_9HYME|nr:uncharacterized protein K02A2.6-like [Ceratina calcarata]
MSETSRSLGTSSDVGATTEFPSFHGMKHYVQGEMNWDDWIGRFEAELISYSISENQKRMYLLCLLSTEALNSLCDTLYYLQRIGLLTLTYVELKQKLNDLFAPKAMEIDKNLKFRNRKQQPNENKSAFANALNKENVPKSQNNKNGSSKVPDPNEGTKQGKSNTSNNLRCYRCAKYGHKSIHCRVDPNTLTCLFCNKKGHVADICFMNGINRSNTNYVDQSGSKGEVLDSYGSSNVRQVKQTDGPEKFLMTLNVNGVEIVFEVNNEVADSFMWEKYAREIFKESIFHSTQIKLINYCKTQIPVIGYITVNLQYADSTLKVNLYLTAIAGVRVAGCEWIRKMLHARAVQGIEQVFNRKCPVCTAKREKDPKLRIDKLLSNYYCTKDDLSKITGIIATLTLKKGTRPVFMEPYSLPFDVLSLVGKEIDRLVLQGVLIQVASSQYATPIVPILNKDNTVRLCGDYSVTLNSNLIMDKVPLPTIYEMFASLAECEHFCKIHLKQAYLQLEVDEASTELLIINTCQGLYRPTRLMYGVPSFYAIWQHKMEELLKGFEGVFLILDDIHIGGRTTNQLLNRLELVLTILEGYNIKINKEECEFLQDKVEFWGYVINKHGLHESKRKIEPIENIPRPQNVNEVRSFIEFVSYYSHFIPDVSNLLQPLHKLLQNGIKFKWSEECDESFLRIKNEFMSDKCFTSYNPNLPLILRIDASRLSLIGTGVGAVLSHMFPDGTERPIMWILESLNSTQREYDQMDKEAYAIVSAVKKLHEYLYGNKFTLVTNNRPLKHMFSLKNSLPTLRFQGYATFLRAYNYDIVYKRPIISIDQIVAADRDNRQTSLLTHFRNFVTSLVRENIFISDL